MVSIFMAGPVSAYEMGSVSAYEIIIDTEKKQYFLLFLVTLTVLLYYIL